MPQTTSLPQTNPARVIGAILAGAVAGGMVSAVTLVGFTMAEGRVPSSALADVGGLISLVGFLAVAWLAVMLATAGPAWLLLHLARWRGVSAAMCLGGTLLGGWTFVAERNPLMLPSPFLNMAGEIADRLHGPICRGAAPTGEICAAAELTGAAMVSALGIAVGALIGRLVWRIAYGR
ncbi:MAG: hypothetical protein R3D33_00655 [Hyphomicrobiaceae bacterium]